MILHQFCAARLHEEGIAYGDADIDEDAMIANYLASQLEDFECEPDGLTVPPEWPKSRGSKLLDQTLWVYIICDYLWSMSLAGSSFTT